MRLLCKPFGRVYDDRPLGRAELLAAIEVIFPCVYGIASPQDHPGFRAIVAAVEEPGARSA
jgi:hypothetical protein